MQTPSPGNGLARLAPPRPVAFILSAYVIGLLLFAVARLIFLLHFPENLDDLSIWKILTAFAIGTRFDTVILAAAFVPLTLTLPWTSPRLRSPGPFAIGYLALVLGFLFLLLLADIRFYEEYDNHLNFHVFDYLAEGRTAWNLVLTDPMFYFLLGIWAALIAAFIAGLLIIRRLVRPMPIRRSWTNTAAYAVLLLALSVLGIRGRTDLAPIDWGIAYFSHNHFGNQLTLNAAYTLSRTLTEYQRDPRLSFQKPPVRWPFVDFATALDTTQVLIGLPHETWLEPDSSLKRVARQPRAPYTFAPNVILVLLESFSGRHTGILDSSLDLTPHFDSLSRHGLLFNHFYATGTRTSYGIAGTVCSFPSLPGRAILKRYDADHPFITLSEILKERNYYNAFFYGGDIAFDNMAGFLKTKKYDLLLGEEDFGREFSFSKWGIPDHVLFEKTINLLDTLPRPIQLTLLTLSNHTPFALPDSSVRRYQGNDRRSRVYNAQLYADWAVGQFMAGISKEPVFDSTIFVFTGDHALWDVAQYVLDPINLHIPLLIYAPKLLGDSGRIIETYSGQCDLLPTLMGLLGGSYVHESWGRDILKLPPSDSGFAIVNHSRVVGYIDPFVFYMEILGEPPVLMSTPLLGLDTADIAGNSSTDDSADFFEGATLLATAAPTGADGEIGTDRSGHIDPGRFSPWISGDSAAVNDNPADITALSPDLLTRIAIRLHHFMQTADQLTLPENLRDPVH